MIKADVKNRSRRLRKKLYIEEFKVLGFNVDMTFSSDSSDEAFDTFFEEFLGKFADENELIFGGAGTQTSFSGFIVPYERYLSATEEHRKLTTEWLTAHKLIENFTVGELTDANVSA